MPPAGQARRRFSHDGSATGVERVKQNE